MDLFDKFYLWNRKINQDMEVLSKKLDPQTGVYKMPESEYRARKAKKASPGAARIRPFERSPSQKLVFKPVAREKAN